MSWAARRRFIILFILAAIAGAFLVIVAIATFYKTPSCTDNKQNQGESGIDCGGPCSTLCSADEVAPTVLYTKAVSNGNNRTDVIASVENVNANAAAKNVPYTIALYGANQVLLKEIKGTIDLPPTASVPLFVPGVSAGSEKITNAFLTLDDPTTISWIRYSNPEGLNPVVGNTTVGGTQDAPRIVATLTNKSISALQDVHVIAVVHNAAKEVIAASSTVVPTIPAQGDAIATFTWNAPFQDVPATIEIIPIRELP